MLPVEFIARTEINVSEGWMCWILEEMGSEKRNVRVGSMSVAPASDQPPKPSLVGPEKGMVGYELNKTMSTCAGRAAAPCPSYVDSMCHAVPPPGLPVSKSIFGKQQPDPKTLLLLRLVWKTRSCPGSRGFTGSKWIRTAQRCSVPRDGAVPGLSLWKGSATTGTFSQR